MFEMDSDRYSDQSDEQGAENLVCRPIEARNSTLRDMTPSHIHGYFEREGPGGGLIMDETKETRSSLRQLEFLAANLPPRDLDILRDIEARRYMTSGQIRRLRFWDASTPGSAQRIANRVTSRLKGHGLIFPLDRRIGGVRGGSGENVWALTPSGFRLLRLDDSNLPRKRGFEPSRRFEEHTLAIAELDVQLRSIAGVTVTQAQFEPACWREYNGRRLKPDYFTVTVSGNYEDFWFFEIDLATESPSQVVAKCEQYQDYYRSGVEQRATGIFPRVVWVTLNSKRRESIERHIRASRTLRQKDLFLVILPNELDPTIRRGAAL